MKPQSGAAPNFMYALLQLPKTECHLTLATRTPLRPNTPLSTEVILFPEIRIYRNPIGRI